MGGAASSPLIERLLAEVLGDETSRRALIDVLRLRVLGPYHAFLRVTAEGFRARQHELDRAHRLSHGTFEVSDPWFTPLSLYRLPGPGGAPITLHGHSVDL